MGYSVCSIGQDEKKACMCYLCWEGLCPVPLPAMYCLLGSILQDVADLVLVSCFLQLHSVQVLAQFLPVMPAQPSPVGLAVRPPPASHAAKAWLTLTPTCSIWLLEML